MRASRGALRHPEAPSWGFRLRVAALLIALAAQLPRCAGVGCPYALSLSPLGNALPAAYEDEGWCRAFSFSGASTANATCRGISVPPGTVVAYGTCGLSGAACTGATRLALRDAATGMQLDFVDRVPASSPMASLELGCGLGHRCSYGEWRNPALVSASVLMEQGCVGVTPCTGVTGWRLLSDPALTPALTPSTTPALAFTVRATAALRSIDALAGNVTTGAAAAVYSYAGDAFASNTLGASASWTPVWTGTWPSNHTVPLSPPPTIAAGAVVTLMVVATAGGAPVCAHTLGDATQTLLSDARAVVNQGAAMPSAFGGRTAGNASCALDGLALSYTAVAPCPPPPPPPVALIATNPGSTLVMGLDDLLRALISTAVTEIVINAHIELNGTQLAVTLPLSGSRDLTIKGTDLCKPDDSGRTARCSISAAGLSRVLNVDEGVTLYISHLQLRDGLAPPATAGGCVLMNCSTCSLEFNGASLSNCTATDGVGGGIAAIGGGALTANELVLDENIATVGGGLVVVNSVLTLANSSFIDNVASGMSDNTIDLCDLPGTLGGGAALFDAQTMMTGCTFSANAAYTDDVLLSGINPALPQARGGAIFVYGGSLTLSTSNLDGNKAYFGGAIYIDDSEVSLSGCALAFNEATTGSGGALFSADCTSVTILDSLLEGNSAGGFMGGGVAVLNASVVISRSSFRENWAPAGCGVGISTDGALLLNDASVAMGNEALSGGALCCDECNSLQVADSFLYSNVALTGHGGAVAVSLTPSAITNCTMAFNSAPQGGAVGASSSSLNITDCVLSDNLATDTHGGAVFHTAVDNGIETMNILRTLFANNTAVAAGGAVSAFSSASVVLDSCTISNNSATGPAPAGGGVAALDVVMLTVQNCNISSNFVLVAAALAADANLAYIDSKEVPGSGSGGGLWIGADDALNASVLGTTISSNSAGQAGGIYLTGAVTLLMRDSHLRYNAAVGFSSEGGGLVTDRESVANVFNTHFLGCSAVRGGGGWHGAASQSSYDGCRFEANVAIDGDDIKGSALIVGEESSTLTVTRSTFVRNVGAELCEGTIAMERSADTSLRVTDSLFDGNVARLGAGFLLAAESQLQQFGLSNVTFQNQRAYIGAVMYAESAEYGDLLCSPHPCTWSVNNSAADYGDTIATPPKIINASMPTSVRSGAPLSIQVTMQDGFGALLQDWDGLVATIETDAMLIGTTRTFYLSGAANFNGLALFGVEGTAYNLTFVMDGPDLFGNDVTTGSITRGVTVLPCEPGERFNNVTLECECAVGWGLVVADHTCRQCALSEVVPENSLSCTSCPDFSAPSSTSECRCMPGYFGTIVGAVGACTKCPADSFRSAEDPPYTCRSCPPTSHTFALGATSELYCLCALNFFNDRSGLNSSFSCAPVPIGGWAPQADSRLFALDNYWRPDAKHTTFFECTTGLCLKEDPPTNTSAAQLGHRCRPGHTGHLCAVCDDNWAYRSTYCEKCKAGQQWTEWGYGQKLVLSLLVVGLICIGAFILFLLPLFPNTESMLSQAVAPAVERMEEMLSNVAAATRPLSAAGSRPTSAARRRLSVTRRARMSMPAAEGHETGGKFAVVQRATRVEVFLETVKEPARIIISFWQVVSSFSNNLYVPWPNIYYALANTLSVASLSFMRLPALNCIRPQLSFFTSFLFTTLSFLAFCTFAVCTYYIGQKSQVAMADPERKRRFKARVLNGFWWGAFLVYPQVSSTTLLIFACTELEDGTSWLMADYRIQCWTSKHKLYVGLGVLFAVLFPLGIPVAIIYSLYTSRVPELAEWKNSCSWLRAIVQRSMVLGVQAPCEFNPDTLTTESITIDHLRLLHRTFVATDEALPPDVSAALHHASISSGGSQAIPFTRRQLLHAVHASAVAGGDPTAVHDDDVPLLATAAAVAAAAAEPGSRRGTGRMNTMRFGDDTPSEPGSRRATTRLNMDFPPSPAVSRRGSVRLGGDFTLQAQPEDVQEEEDAQEVAPPPPARSSLARVSFIKPAAPDEAAAPLLSAGGEADAPPRRKSMWRVSSSQEPEEEGPVPGRPAPAVDMPLADPPNSPVRRRSTHAGAADRFPSPGCDHDSDSDSDSDSDDKPRSPGPGPRMLRSVSSQLLHMQPHPAHHHPHPPPVIFMDRLRAVYEEVRRLMRRFTSTHVRTVRRAMSSMIYRDEREKLIGALIEWAVHDMNSSVLRPHSSMVRWRTLHEWDALRAAGVRLGERDATERGALQKFRFLFADYAVYAWWWEAVDVLQKLFLTSLIAFVAPRTAVQVIVASMFAFSMVLITTQVRPYREASNNQLISLSQINIFLFLFCGLLLQTNPNGISAHRLLFSVIVGALTTSIVLFTLYLFTRSLLWQLMAALYAVEDEEAAELEAAEKEEQLYAAEDGHVTSDDEHPPGELDVVISTGRKSAAQTSAGRLSAYAARRMSEHERSRAAGMARMSQSGETGWWARVKQHRLLILVILGTIIGVSVGTSRHHKAAVAVVDDGVARFTLVINRQVLPGSGSEKRMVTVNGTVPGPTLRVAPGQRVEVTVYNAMQDEDTTVHWHGMMQRGTPSSDGVPGLTQCPIPVNGSTVYTFTPHNPGTYWYHGHFNGQYPDGLYGPLIVDDGGVSVVEAAEGDSRSVYENDEWNWMIADFYDDQATELLPWYLSPESGGDEPMPDYIVVNNQPSNTTGGGVLHVTSRSTKQRVRVTNAAAFSMWNVSVDGVPLTVIEVDGTTVEPLDLPYVVLNVAQRVSFVLDWARMASSLVASPAVYIRVNAMPGMYPTYDPTEPDDGLEGSTSGKAFELTWLGVVRFDDDGAAPGGLPTYAPDSPPRVTLAPQAETNILVARPYPPTKAPAATRHLYLEVVFQADDSGVNRAYLNGATFPNFTPAELRSPPMFNGSYLASLQPSSAQNLVCDAVTPCVLPFGEVVEILINNTDGGEHPFHAHGHDFFVVSTSEAPDAEALYSPVFLRRDVVSIPANGWARIRFVADNPGAWLFHCHIEWHMHAGLMATLIEAPDKLLTTGLGSPPTHVANTCAAYATTGAAAMSMG